MAFRIHPLLQVSNLRTSFFTDKGEIKAVDDVSFTIHGGQTLALVGESACGKSVTALSIMRLLSSPGRVVGGTINFNGQDLLSLPETAMRKIRGKSIAMVFQEPMTSLNPVMRIGDQIGEVLKIHTDLSKTAIRQEVIGLLEKVRIASPEQRIDQYPHEMSGGMKQRVMIAMALACRPRLLVADEPTTALDVSVQQSILELITDLRRDFDTSVLFITHDLGIIAEIADRVLIMQQGNIVEQGPVLDIFERPQHPYTQGLLACRPPLDAKVRRLPVVSDFMQAQLSPADFQRKIAELHIPPAEIETRLQQLQQQQPLLRVANLKTWFSVKKGFFGSVQQFIKAVDEVSFEVFPGETLGLVGESGCGKTTLGRTLLRLVSATAGRIEFDNRNLLQLPEAELKSVRRDMQIIFQDPYSSLNPRLTIGMALVEPMQVHGIGHNDRERRERALELLETVGLEAAHFYRYPHEFSGGQRQRICIARALALQPRFLICDECVSALDVSVQAQILNLLMELREQHRLTYIFISHDLSVVKLMSDRLMVMREGKIVEYGAAETVYRQPQSDYTRQLIAAIPKGRVEDIRRRLNH